MNQTFFKVKFEDKNVIDYDMFREINEIIAKIRFEGYGKILAPRYDYYDNTNIVNDLGNEMYVVLYILHGDEQRLRNLIRNDIKKLGHIYSYDYEMPNFIEIFFNTSQLDDSIKFEKAFKSKIEECGGSIKECSVFKNKYDFAITFSLECKMADFDDKLNEILDLLKKNIGEKFFIEYF